MADVELEAAGLPKSRAVSLGFSFTVNGIGALLLGGLALRLILAFLPGFGADVGLFRFWADSLAANNPWDFYENAGFIDYAPGYLYLLWLLGELNQLLHFSPDTYQYLLKLPPIAADLATAYLIYRLLDRQKQELRLAAAGVYLSFPPALLIGSVWGQADSVLAFFVLLSVYFVARGRPLAGALAFVVAFVVKPQAIAVLPFLAFWIMRENPPRWTRVGNAGATLPLPPRLWLHITVASVALLLLLILPFFPDRPWELVDRLATSARTYPYNSVNAYNFWGIWGFWRPDTAADALRLNSNPDGGQFLGLDHMWWGIGLFASATLAVIASTWKTRGTGALALGTALSVVAFHVFLTRMHERYLFPAFAPLLVACVLMRLPVLWGAFAALGLLHLANLYYPYVHPTFNPDGKDLYWDNLFTFLEDRGKVLSLLTAMSFPALLAIGLARRLRPWRSKPA